MHLLNKVTTVFQGQEFYIAIELPNRSLQQAKICCDWRLKSLLTGYEHLLEQVTGIFSLESW